MTERELLQEALAGLPRPAPPPRLRRAVMARVTAEAQAEVTASQAWTWSRTEEGGQTAERRGGAGASGRAAPTPAHIIYTHWRRDEPGRTMIYQFMQTH